VKFEPFDPVRKRAEAEARRGSQRLRVAKGAPQAILALVKADGELLKRVHEETDTLAARGCRTLGVASADDGGGWRFLGLLPLFDPPRDDSAETIETAKKMGLQVRMVTGDHVAIARETAAKLGLATNIVSAREVFEHETSDGDGARIEEAGGFAEVFPSISSRSCARSSAPATLLA